MPFDMARRRGQVVVLEAEEDCQFVTERQASSSHRYSTETVGRRDDLPEMEVVEPHVIDLSDDDVVDLTMDESDIKRSLLKQGEYALASLCISADVISRGSFIEVHSIKLGSYHINFVLVKVIVRNYDGHTILRGIPYTRTRNLTSKLQKKLNEVCEIIHLDQDGSLHDPGFVDVSIECLIKVRQVIMTNALWPAHSHSQFGEIRDQDERRRALEAMGTLVCRWRFTIISVSQGRKSKPVEEVLSRLHASEVEPQYRVGEQDLCTSWRGGRVLGGS
jgi:hypothetical protein